MGRLKKLRPPEMPAEALAAILADMGGEEGLGTSNHPEDNAWLGEPTRPPIDVEPILAAYTEQLDFESFVSRLQRTKSVKEKVMLAYNIRRSGRAYADPDELIDEICKIYYLTWCFAGEANWSVCIAACVPGYAEMDEDKRSVCYRRIMARLKTEKDWRLVRLTYKAG